MRVANRIELLVANVGDDVDGVVHRIDVFGRADLDLLWRSAHNITQHLAPEGFVRIAL